MSRIRFLFLAIAVAVSTGFASTAALAQDIEKFFGHFNGSGIAENADMPGFPRAEQRLLAFLIGSQRHAVNLRFRKKLPRDWREAALRLAILLRLGVLLNRSRSGSEVPVPGLEAGNDTLHLHFDRAWLDENPLTEADLKRERKHLKDAGYRLTFD